MPPPTISRRAAAALACLVTPLIAHALFSPLGFNPTDDGFTLAYARRLLDGQMPHRDFIIIRPALSPLLWVPLVKFGGRYTYLVGRALVWFQLAQIAWWWTLMTDRRLDLRWPPSTLVSVAIVSMAIGTHTFPIMPWHTTDGLFLTTLGMALVFLRPSLVDLGYLLLGAAVLCKQNFAIMPAAVLAATGDWRSPRRWAAVAAPAIAYAVVMVASGAQREAWIQLTAQHGVMQVGIYPYLSGIVLLTAAFGALGRLLLRSEGPVQRGIAVVLMFGPPLGATIGAFLTATYGGWVGFVWMGSALGTFAPALVSPDARGSRGIFVLGLAAAWCVSISIGKNSPALATGILWTLMVAVITQPFARQWGNRSIRATLAAVAGLVALAFGYVRTHEIYRDRVASELTVPLDDVLPGAAGIRTNPNTARFIRALADGVDREKAENRGYAIVPDAAGWWVQSYDRNALPIDWMFDVEIRGRPEIAARVIRSLDARRNTETVLLETVSAADLAKGNVPIGPGYSVAAYVRTHYQLQWQNDLIAAYR